MLRLLSPQAALATLGRWWQRRDRPGWRNFFTAMAVLSVALLLALYSVAAAKVGRMWLAGGTALAALALAVWVAVAMVPALARRTALRWLAVRLDYRLTREGIVYLLGVLVIVLAALNTGNNLLYMILGAMLAGILVSGVLSRLVLAGVELRLELPDHIFAEQPIALAAVLHNHKQVLPSFSLSVAGDEKKGRGFLERPIYFAYLPSGQAARQSVEVTFPRRGSYRQSVVLRTRFPFGFLEKIRPVEANREVLVYPRILPTEEFYEVLPLISGEMESLYRGRGHDLYAIRDYQAADSARFVDWKATARSAALKVREFTREDERRVLLVLDPFLRSSDGRLAEKFERAVTLCACLAWHFYEVDAELAFRTHRASTPMAPAGEIIYDLLRELALVQPQPAETDGSFLLRLTDEPDLFKIILTSQPRGSIPTSLWTSSYVLFFDSL